jgi:uncharacterized protein (TIGR03086 family)
MAHTTRELVDFGPATATMAQVLAGIDDRHLTGGTPCPAYTVADVVDHVAGLTVAFTAAARKDPVAGHGPSGDGAQLQPGWRERITADLDVLAEAWRDRASHEGFTMAGPIEMPARVAALVALDELVVHAWDLARATGQPYTADPAAVAACASWVEGFQVPAEVSDGGPFGPAVPVPVDAPAIDRLVGLTGRNPAWTP